MNIQAYISKLLRRPETRRRGARGASMPRVAGGSKAAVMIRSRTGSARCAGA